MVDARPIRDYLEASPVNPQPFDPRSSFFLPDLYVTDQKVAGVSVRKVQGIGIKVYDSTTNATLNNTADTLTFDTVAFNQNFQESGATFNFVTIPYTGVYTLTGLVEFESNSSGARTVGFEIDEDTVIRGGARLPSTGVWRLTWTDDRLLEAGQTVGVRVSQNSGATLDLSAGEDNQALSVIYRFSV